jgi:hypothetical protein
MERHAGKAIPCVVEGIEFWAITVFLILLGGSVGVFEGTKTHPIDWSLCFFVGVGAISTVRNFLSGVAAHGGPRAKRRRLKRQLSRSRVPDGGLSGKGQFAKLEQEGDNRYVQKAALETLGRLQEPVLEETERAFQKAIRLNPQDVADLLQEPWGLEKLSSLNETADASLRTPIDWRDIFN